MCESYVQECSKPCSSAFFVRSTSRVYGGSGRTVTPKVRRVMGPRAYAVVPVPDNGLGSAGTVPERGLSHQRLLGQTPAASVPPFRMRRDCPRKGTVPLTVSWDRP